MRIISGRFRGHRLHTFKGLQVRPTADRVRESLFNIIASGAMNAHVLDLFAGTGALGIEALSRGAETAVFIDNSTSALTLLRKNLAHCHLRDGIRIIQWDIARNLGCLGNYGNHFNLVFMDPPYHKGLIPLVMGHLLQSQCLAPGALIVAEHEAGIQPAIDDVQLMQTDYRCYGHTGLSFFLFRPDMAAGSI